MVNSLFDGMNWSPRRLCGQYRNGVVMLSRTPEPTRSSRLHLSVNPFDIQEQADGIYRALIMEPRARCGPGA